MALAVYLAVLCVLRAAGFFALHPDAGIAATAGARAILDAEILSAPGEDYRGLKIEVRLISLNGTPAAPQRAIAYFPWFFARGGFLRPGERARFFGRLEAPQPARNPGGFDERAFLEERGACWVFWAEDFERLPFPVPARRLPLYWAQALREKMQEAYYATLQARKAHVLSGLMFGDKGRLDSELYAAVQDAGVMHLLVPSGAKVALVLLFAAWLLSALGVSRVPRFCGAALAAGFYTVMVGASAPYVRAYGCALAYYAALLLDRDAGVFQGLVLSAWAILLWDPRSLFSLGFEMTYLAMLGLSAADAWAARLGEGLPARSSAGRLLRSAAATAAVELMLWPIFAGVFGRGSVLGSAANLVLIPCAAGLMAGGLVLGAAFMAGWTPLIRAAAWAMSLGLGAFCRTCFLFSGLPFSASALFPMSACSVIAYYAASAAFLFDWPRAARAAILCAAAGFWAVGAARSAESRPGFRAVYLWPARSGLGAVEAGGRAVVFGSGAPRSSLDGLLRTWRLETPDEIVLAEDAPAGAETVWRTRFPGVHLRRARGPWRLCAGAACAGFGPDSFQAGPLQFDIIASLLKGRAVEIEIHGQSVGYEDASGTSTHLLGRPFLQ
ncbi:MAG: ComEC/Rec2 family competence protein [Elusimicrobia bacterium]|nr:ComEC/Rec2 family competence protein [Elusimicrobiota bacterium]MDE2313044.1 ComEC/Rec2 family competence protein [Elusimicrobiota bacterium]